MKETEDNINRWKYIPCSWTGRMNTIKMTMLPKATYRVCNPYQNTKVIFHRTRKNNFKICRETQKTLNSQNNLEKEESYILTSYYTTKLQ